MRALLLRQGSLRFCAALRCAAILIGEQALRRCFLQVLECGGRLLVGTTGLERMVVLYP